MAIHIRNSDMRDLVAYAESLGWAVEKSKGNHIKFSMDGSKPIFTSSTPSDPRAWKNCRSRLKRLAVAE